MKSPHNNNVEYLTPQLIKQRNYELTLILQQCQYTSKSRVQADCEAVFKGYYGLQPILVDGDQLEINGEIHIKYQDRDFKIKMFIRIISNYPTSPPFIYLINVDVNRFDANPLYQTGVTQNGEQLLMNNFIPEVHQWNNNKHLVSLIAALQKQLSLQFPFFQKQHIPPQPLQQQQQLPICDSQYGMWERQQQSQYNGYSIYNQSTWTQPIQSNKLPIFTSTYYQNPIQNQILPLPHPPPPPIHPKQEPQVQQKLSNKPKDTSQTGWELAGQLIQSLYVGLIEKKEVKEKKLIAECQQKVNIRTQQISTMARVNIAQQREHIQTLVKHHEIQTKLATEHAVVEKDLHLQISKADDLCESLNEQYQQCQSIDINVDTLDKYGSIEQIDY